MKSVKKELLITSLGVAALRIIMLVLFTIVPLSHFGYIWFAPIMISLMLVLGYYAILKCQVIVLSKKWLKFLSYVVIITTAAASYMLIFYLIINVLFKIHNLSTEVYILNFLMVTILFIIMPIVSEVGGFVHTLIKRDDEYLAYLLKKMNKMTTEVDADELAEFIAKQLKFEYVGIVIGKKVHGPKSESFTDAEIKTIIALKNPEHGIWQELDSGAKNILYSHKVEAVAAMRDARGRVFGQMLIGTPRGKNDLSQKDLYELNQIVNLVSAMIDSRAK